MQQLLLEQQQKNHGKTPQTFKTAELPRSNSSFFLAWPNLFLTDMVFVPVTHPTEICPLRRDNPLVSAGAVLPILVV